MALFSWQTVVIKVGSALIAPDGKGCTGQFLLPIARYISQCRQQGKHVILVSSGSVAAGRGLIQHGEVPSIAEKQAMAAVGQMEMMANWGRFFEFPYAQILVTHEDLADRRRYINIQNTLRTLLSNGILPIINENDSVATAELKVGDNDNLAALVAQVSHADMMIICSDIDGLFTADPRINKNATLISEVPQITAEIYALAGGTTNKIATGGMRTKIEAAEKATTNGVHCLIVNGRNDQVFNDLLQGKQVGTWFHRQANPQKARKNWLQHTLKSQGEIVIDLGAAQALMTKGASLLSIGIKKVRGDFYKGDAVSIVLEFVLESAVEGAVEATGAIEGLNQPCALASDVSSNTANQISTHLHSKIVAKGICQYSATELSQIKGLPSHDIIQQLGYCPSDVVIHRDDLVVLTTSY